jgi:ribonuclease R
MFNPLSKLIEDDDDEIKIEDEKKVIKQDNVVPVEAEVVIPDSSFVGQFQARRLHNSTRAFNSKLYEGKLVKPNLIISSTNNKKCFLVQNEGHSAFIGDTVKYEVVVPSTVATRLDTVRIKSIVSRQSDRHFAIVTTNQGHVQPWGSSPLTVFSCKEALGLPIGTPLLVKVGENENETVCKILYNLELYTDDEIIIKTFDIDTFEFVEPVEPSKHMSITKDQTNLFTITIDPPDSRDYDDALSVDSENHKIFIHIADVSRYVPLHSKLDRRLMEREFSIYLNRRVAHMAPTQLATDFCSLNEGVERFVVTVEFDYDPSTYTITSNGTHYRSIIKSKKRYTYDQVELIKNDENTPIHILQKVFVNNKFEKRVKDSMPEIKIVGDQKKMEVFQEDDSHQMVEFFMLWANQYTAKTLYERGVIFPSRVHPFPVNMKNFENASKVTLPTYCTKEFKTFLLLRCLAPASYGINSQIGHFALNMEFYTHFTSPIRRYIDIVIHRLLMQDAIYTKEQLDHICSLANAQESRTKQIESFQGYLHGLTRGRQDLLANRRFTGIIYQIAKFGIYIYICENMQTTFISVNDCSRFYRDFFTLNESSLVGKYKSINLYDKIYLRIRNVDSKVNYIITT